MAKGTVVFEIIGHDRSGSAAFLKVAAAANRADGALDRFGRNTNTIGSSIDRTSGRLALFAKAAAVVGPSLAPIGAVAIPALTGLVNQAGFAAVAAGTMVLAFQGVGDGLKAVNKAALEPTAENLAAAREAMEALSPAGRDMVRQLQSMRPLLTELRDTGQEAAFPGLIAGLEELESLAPKVDAVIAQVAGAIGDLFAEGAESLAGDRWADFFDTLAREARPTLESIASSIGSLAHGLSELWEAFAPLNRDFGDWMADAAHSFDEWATGVGQTQGFQDFVGYISANGPKVAEAAGSIANALLQVIEAAAPLGGPVLDAISGLADALAAVADSPIGTPLMAAVTTISALSLASGAATKSVTKLSGALGALGATGAAGSLGASAGKGGPWGVMLLGLIANVLNTQKQFEELEEGSQGLGETLAKSFIPGFREAAALHEVYKSLNKDQDAARKAAAELEYMRTVTGGGWDSTGMELFYEALGMTAVEARRAAQGVDQFSRSAARAMGILNQQAAIDAFHEAVDSARKSWKEFGKGLDETKDSGRQNRAALRGIAESALAAAEGLKGIGRVKFLDNAADQIAKWAEKMGMGERRAERFANRVLGLNNVRGAPTVDLDDKAGRRKVMQMLREMDLLDGTHANPAADLMIQQFLQGKVSVERMMRFLNGLNANPNVGADIGGAISSINAVESRLNGLNGRTAHTYVYTHFRRTGSGQGQGASPNEFATGTPSAPRGWAWVGEQGPELVRFRGGEQVLTASRSRAFAAASARANVPAMRAPVMTPMAGASAGTVRHVIEVRVVGGEIDLTKAKAQISGIAREISREEIEQDRTWSRTQGG